MSRIQILRKWLRYNLGLAIYSFGVYCTIHADLGAAPWDIFYLGLSGFFGVSYGFVVMVTGVLVVFLDLWMGEKIGFGTLFDAFLTGYYTDFWMHTDPVGNLVSSWPGRALLLVAGLFILSLGMFFAMSAGQGCGPKDAMFLGIGKRLRRLPIGLVQILLQAVVLFIGWILGGPVGAGTVIAVVMSGAALQIVFRALSFEPRDTVHYNVIETLRMLAEG